MILGLAVACGLIVYVEVTLRRIERRLDAMTVSPSRHAVWLSACLDCGVIDAHTEDCALSMDNLTESPTDAAARRGRD